MHDADTQDAATLEAYRHQVARLPITMRPVLNQQISEWANLFPYEQKRAAEFLDGVAKFDTAELTSITQPLRELEIKMDVPHWNYSIVRDTMQNASLLARSSHYIEWRKEVQRVFSAIEAKARESAPPPSTEGRVVLLILPETLPVKTINSPKEWDVRGREYRIAGDARQICELAVQGQNALPATLEAQAGTTSSDCWLIDADAKLGSLISATDGPAVSLLDYETLRPFRDQFLAAANTVPKDIEASDEILEKIRRQNWDHWWPSDMTKQSRLRSFVIELFLSGNGAMIFSNAFVQWASSEALRRARPRLVVGRFGLRGKPKPFTSIAIFENQNAINKLHEVDDPEGSAIDALILARYVWLAVARYPEREQTCCVCVSEAANSVYVIAPEARKPSWASEHQVTPDAVCAWMRAQLKV